MTEITAAARLLAGNLLSRNISIKHVQALDLLAAGAGLANRHVLAQHTTLPSIRRVNLKLLTSAATALAQHDAVRRQTIIEETSTVLIPAEAMIELEEYDLRILPSELGQDPNVFLDTDRGEAFLKHLMSDMYYERYSTSQSDRPMSIKDANELATAILEVKRAGGPDQAAEISRTLAQHFNFGHRVENYWWHYAHEDVSNTLEKINSDLADLGDNLAIDESEWLEVLETIITDRLNSEDDSKPEDLLSRFDYCEVLFFFQRDGYTLDEMISSNKSWADYGDLHVGPELQFALSRLGYSLEEYRMLSGNRNPGDDLMRGLKKRKERLVEPDELQEIVENACAQYFLFTLYGIVPITDLIKLDLSQPVTFDQAAVATHNPFSGTFQDVIKKMPITVKPSEGCFRSGGEGYSPDSICGLYTPVYHARLSNPQPSAPNTAIAA